MEKLIPRPDRVRLRDLSAAGSVVTTRLELEERTPKHVTTARWIDHRWGPNNPKRRAARAAAAWLEDRGVEDLLVGLPSRAPLYDRADRNHVFFGFGAVDEAIDALGLGAERCLCVFNEGRKRAPLVALEVTTPLAPSQRERLLPDWRQSTRE